MLLLGFSLLLQWWSIVFLLSLYTVILLFGNMHSYNYGNAGLKWKAAGFENSAYNSLAAAAAKLLQSCLTLCNLIDGSPPGSAVPGILQARTLGWLAISFSSAWKWQLKMTLLSRVRLFTTPWTAAPQAAPPMGFSRQEYWSGLPLPSLSYQAQVVLNRFFIYANTGKTFESHECYGTSFNFCSTALCLQDM